MYISVRRCGIELGSQLGYFSGSGILVNGSLASDLLDLLLCISEVFGSCLDVTLSKSCLKSFYRRFNLRLADAVDHRLLCNYRDSLLCGLDICQCIHLPYSKFFAFVNRYDSIKNREKSKVQIRVFI